MSKATIKEDERPTPEMDIFKVRSMLNNCSIKHPYKCKSCDYCGTSDCKSRLMLEASHALTVLLDERDGKPFILRVHRN